MNVPWPPAGTVPLPIGVVSIQSQVIYGRVGNNVAVPTLRALGHSVAVVPTVLLSNTPHYASMHGGAIPDDWFSGWLDDLVARGALRSLQAVQSGYLGSAAQASSLALWLRARVAAKPGLRVIVDPVIGDHDHGVYVDAELVDAMRRYLLPLADGLTPNDFELAHLTGRDVVDTAGAIAAARSLLTERTQWVVVTSAVPATWPRGQMRLLVVARDATHIVTHPRVDIVPKGTGDLFTASLTGYWLRGEPLRDAVLHACRRVLRAMRLTARERCAELLLPPSESRPADDAEIAIQTLPAT